jgi:ABC-type nitrate/sulfonate/bicarbonate transport system substrate-binding protein
MKKATTMLGSLALGLGLLLNQGPAQAEPVKIRVGIGSAVEEQIWLLIARPDLGTNYGKAYTIDWNRFPGADKRIQAFEAGAQDVITASANGAILAASEGIDFKMVASLSRESSQGFFTKFMVRESSPLRSVKDLKGKKIGINGFNGSGHLWTHVVLEANGMSEKDVTLVPLPFPAQAEGLKSGTIDVGMFPQPFARMVEKDMPVRSIYSSKDAAAFDEELMLLIAKPEWINKNSAALKAMIEDLVAVTKYYAEHSADARQALIEKNMVRIDKDTYVSMQDYYRDPSVRVSLTSLEKMQDLQMRAGFQSKKVDLACRVDLACKGK